MCSKQNKEGFLNELRLKGMSDKIQVLKKDKEKLYFEIYNLKQLISDSFDCQKIKHCDLILQDAKDILCKLDLNKYKVDDKTLLLEISTLRRLIRCEEQFTDECRNSCTGGLTNV